MSAKRYGSSSLLLAAILTVAGVLVAAQEDYCNPDLCNAGVVHTGCNNPNELSANCKDLDASKWTFDDKLKKVLLDEFNGYRNQVAKGEVKWLPKAANMVRMDWDDDLAYLAELHANTCPFAHDLCRNTKKYPDSGQNIAIHGLMSNTPDPATTIKEQMKLWWDERQHATKKIIKKLPSDAPAGHFTMMVRSNANRVGCAVVRFKSNDWFYWGELICNFSYTNMIGGPIYNEGEPCSECKTGCDAEFDGLCNKDEPVDLGVRD